MPATYFLGTRLLGDSILNPMWADSEPAHYNQALFCCSCGDIWGRVVYHQRSIWVTTNRSCGKHGGGSFIAPWRTTFEELPPEVLQYELQLRLNQLERG